MGLLACSRFEPPKIRNVLLISMDTTRADHLGCYGYQYDSTPNIDAIAAEGTRFTHAVSPAPLTLPSHSTLLTGMEPLDHGVRDNDRFRLDESSVTLAEVLSENDFDTGAVVGAFVLDSRFGLAQGFDHYDDEFGETRAATSHYIEQTADDGARDALSFLERSGANPFFLFLHFFDPHSVYGPPGHFGSRFGPESYVGEVAYTDWAIGLVVDKLKERGLYESTLIVVTADHGESLGEHGELSHGYFIYEATTHIPLIFRLPSGRSVREVGGTVGLVDVMPTILSLLGLPAPDSVTGRDLSPLILGTGDVPTQALYLESFEGTKIGSNPLRGLIGNRWKYIQGARPELFDLQNDPDELENLALQQPERASRIEAQLQERLEVSGFVGNEVPLDEDERRRLEALGYLIGSAAGASKDIDPKRPEARDLIGVFVKLLTVRALVGGGLLDEARALSEEILKESPETPLAYQYLGQVALTQRKWNEAISHFRLYLALTADPADSLGADGLQRPGTKPLPVGDRATAHSSIGVAYAGLREFAQAEAEFRMAVRLRPDDAAEHFNLANALLAQDRTGDAGAEYRVVVELDPDHELARQKLVELAEAAASRATQD